MKRFFYAPIFFLLLHNQLVALEAAQKCKVRFRTLPKEITEMVQLYAIHNELFPEKKYVEAQRFEESLLRNFALFPDGKRIALQLWNDVTVYDLEKGTLLQKIGYRDIKGIDVFPCNKKVAILAGEKVRVWDLEKNVSSVHGGYYDDARIAVFNDGKRIVFGKSFPKLVNLESNGAEPNHQFYSNMYDAATKDLKVFPSGDKLATTDERCVIIWDVATGKKQHFLHHASRVSSIAIFPDEQKIATASGREITIWDAIKATKLKEHRSSASIYTLDISSDGSKIAYGGNNSEVEIRDTQNWHLLHSIGVGDHVNGVRFLPNSSDFISRTMGSVKLWVEAKPYMMKYLEKNTDRDIKFLLWLFLKYKNFLHEEYPARSCMRIQDVVSFAKKLNPKKDISVDSLTAIRNRMPKDIQRVLARSLGIYSCSDEKIDQKVQSIRLFELQDRPRKEALARAYAALRG